MGLFFVSLGESYQILGENYAILISIFFSNPEVYPNWKITNFVLIFSCISEIKKQNFNQTKVL